MRPSRLPDDLLPGSCPTRETVLKDDQAAPDAVWGSTPWAERLIAAIERLASAVEIRGAAFGPASNELEPADACRYTRPLGALPPLADEPAMAKVLGIPARTLGVYRRMGKLPGCWVRNGRRVGWDVARTVEAWKRGVA